MSLLKEFSGIPVPQTPNLKKSDSSDAGAADVANKNDVSFSMMRNTINSDGEITGSDVADYLERAGELNDEIDTVPFGLETDDGDVVKVYVNAEQADAFEEEMKNVLGVEDDIEEAINKLAQKFDIVDVVWPDTDKNNSSDVLDLPQSDQEYDSLDALDDGTELDKQAEYDALEPFNESLLASVSEAVASSNTPHEIKWLEDKIAELKKRLDKKPSVARQIKELEHQKKEKELALTMKEEVEPTRREAQAFKKLNEIVMNLAAQGSSGVAAATGYDRDKLTKQEMIAKYIKEKYGTDAAIARDWLKRAGKEAGDKVLPYWLRESLSEPDAETLGE